MVDPNEAPEGYLAVEYCGCDGCAFTYIDKDCLSAICGGGYRQDGCNVIFVKKIYDCKATASWTYDSEGTPVEVPHA